MTLFLFIFYCKLIINPPPIALLYLLLSNLYSLLEELLINSYTFQFLCEIFSLVNADSNDILSVGHGVAFLSTPLGGDVKTLASRLPVTLILIVVVSGNTIDSFLGPQLLLLHGFF